MRNAAQRAARKGKKRQQRAKVAKLHKLEYFVMRNAPAHIANPLMRRVEKRRADNIAKHHTRKAAHSEGETQQN